MMKPRIVWGIVFIVVGVLLVLNGISGFDTISFYGNEIVSMDSVMKKYGVKIDKDLYNAEYYINYIDNQKIQYIIMILIGLGGAVLGTLMIKNSKISVKMHKHEDEAEPEHLEDDRWRL